MKREKLLKWFAMFFAAMLLFTVLSRAADSVNVAQVSTSTPQNRIITHQVTGNGKIEGTRERAVFAKAGQRVGQILVREGESVEKGQALLRLSTGTLKETIADKQAEIDEISLKISDLESASSVNGEKKSKELARAEENYDIAVENGRINMANAQMEVDVARQKLQNYFDSLGFGSEADTATEQALRDEIRSREEEQNQVIMNRNQEVLEAQRAVEDAKMAEASDGTLENTRKELEQAQEELKTLKKLLKKKGAVSAPTDGVVKSISVSTGGQTAEDAAIVLYETTGELRMTGTISKEDLKYVSVGDKASVKGSSGKEIEGAVIETITEDEANPELRTISAMIPEDSLAIGESVEFTVSRDEGPYGCCVPLSAVYGETGKEYVYVLDTQNSVLGEVLIARKVNIVIQDRNESFAALQNGSLSSGQKVVSDADRMIEDGSRVRLQDS
ncbi:MAG: HlyD family efflux transporter periplasmic adaptor subunit [Eubacteriales bacterium]|nr:HlyD family efflux transporter periplasmic adaptor subunit [Eubacteriales bacterium]